jgi:hypothetical protein
MQAIATNRHTLPLKKKEAYQEFLQTYNKARLLQNGRISFYPFQGDRQNSGMQIDINFYFNKSSLRDATRG